MQRQQAHGQETPVVGGVGKLLVQIMAQAKPGRLNIPRWDWHGDLEDLYTLEYGVEELTPERKEFKFGERNVSIFSWLSQRQLKKQEDLPRKRGKPRKKGAWGLEGQWLGLEQ